MKIKFGDIVQDVKCNIDRENNPFEFYVAGDHLDSEDLTIRRRGRFSTDDVGPAFVRKFTAGQILYGSRRTYLKKVAVADFDGICANTTFVFESKDPSLFDQRLLPFLMLSDNFTKWSVSHSKGSTNPYILFSDLAEFEFDLPSLADQKKLADKLWAAYRLKESYKKLLASMDELAKSRFIEMFGDVILNEKNWGVKKWKDVLTIKNGRSQKNVLDANGKYPIYGSGGVMGRTSAYITKANSIIIGRKGTIDKPFIVKEDFWNVDTAFGIEPDNKNISLYYLFFFCLFFDLKRLNKAAVLPSLVKSDLLNILMPIPPISIQNKFTLFIEQLDKSKSELKKSIAAIDDVIRSLIN